ncbi:MAG TPA: vWA domain-containing protein, partial [Kofleriaceae bacterium]
MIDRQRIATFGIATTAVATVALALWLKPWASGSLTGPKPDPVADSHRVDVVFAVDTTGSMGGLLDGAKRTVWSIASHIREVDKNADVHIGLVAYKDLGDVYVTKDFPLTSDMDGVFAELSTYTAEGGGDVPEDVDAALDDAVHKMVWRDGAKKMIFLVGDAPPASRGEVPKFDVSARDAAGKGIMINTIRCGSASDTAEAWQQIASIGAGEFSTIQQNGGVQQIATPYDQKMAELSRTIDSTAVIYGDAVTRGAYEGKMAAQAAAPAAVAADRAAYYAK